MFKHFTNRLERDIRAKTTSRYEITKAAVPVCGCCGRCVPLHNAHVSHLQGMDIKPTEVNVITHPFQRFAVWFGGSMIASLVCHASAAGPCAVL